MSAACRFCGDEVDDARFALGYRVCLFCGEEAAISERATFCVVPMAKSNYVYVSPENRDALKQLNKYANG